MYYIISSYHLLEDHNIHDNSFTIQSNKKTLLLRLLLHMWFEIFINNIISRSICYSCVVFICFHFLLVEPSGNIHHHEPSRSNNYIIMIQNPIYTVSTFYWEYTKIKFGQLIIIILFEGVYLYSWLW